jgi:PIN domain nuclease of toxin-antitoxin system
MGRGTLIVLDTHALVYDALAPSRLSARARKAIDSAFADHAIACSDISLWEIAMLISRKRLDPVMDARQFLDDLISARRVRVLPITAEIAVLSQSDMFSHGDPADRLIAATARLHQAPLVTSDTQLRKLKEVMTIW